MTRREAERLTHQQDTLRSLGFTREESEALRRISMTLQRWYERECGDGNQYGSWAIERDDNGDGPPYLVHHHYRHGQGKDTVTRTKIADRERGAERRLKAILNTRNARVNPATREDKQVLAYYLQTDPRGAALYIIQPGDVPDGADVSSYYTRGICVY